MGDEQPAGAKDDRPSERFPCTSRIFGLVTLGGLAVVFVLVIMDGVSVGHWTVLAAIVLVGLGTWLTMVRPAVHANDDHVLVRNALTDTMVPWHLIESVEVRQVLLIRTEERIVKGLAVGHTARQQLRQSRRGSAGGQGLQPASMFGGDAVARIDYPDAVSQRLDLLAAKRREASRRLKRLEKRWRWVEVVAVAATAVSFAVLLAVVILR